MCVCVRETEKESICESKGDTVVGKRTSGMDGTREVVFWGGCGPVQELTEAEGLERTSWKRGVREEKAGEGIPGRPSV